MNWWEVIVLSAVSSTGVLLTVGKLLLKTAVSHVLAKDLEEYKSNLKSELFERQTVFARLYAHRAKVIAEFYKELMQAEELVSKYLYMKSIEADSALVDRYWSQLMTKDELAAKIEKSQSEAKARVTEAARFFMRTGFTSPQHIATGLTTCLGSPTNLSQITNLQSS